MSLTNPDEIKSEQFLMKVVQDPNDGFLLIDELTGELLQRCISIVLFALPAGRGVTFLPNPNQRFCLDLRKDIDWFRNKKVKRYLSDFHLSVKPCRKEDLQQASTYHQVRGAGLWLTDEIIQLLHDLSSSGRVELYSFSLIEKATGHTAAISFSALSGTVVQDFTMCTLMKDKRSCGSILNRAVGYILQQSGVTLWYWGYQVPYMNEYCAHYQGGLFPRDVFYRVWEETRDQPRAPFNSVSLPDVFTRAHK